MWGEGGIRDDYIKRVKNSVRRDLQRQGKKFLPAWGCTGKNYRREKAAQSKLGKEPG